VYDVTLTREAEVQFGALPLVVRARVAEVFERLRRWPAVSGIKPLQHDLKGSYRLRTGDWRVLFKVDARRQLVTVWRISNRRDAYED
jgi:mRNA interferase RelE/StbE